MRLDIYLTERQIVSTRSRAQTVIKEGHVLVNGKQNIKPSFMISDSDIVELIDMDHPFVGRGGLKLEAAIQRFKVDVNNQVCADIGASTGGFTDCLLQHGAQHVYAIDAGHGQLDRTLVEDGRVSNLEGINARFITEKTLPEKVSIAVADLSFISLTLVLPAIRTIIKENGSMIALIKPQFECGRTALSKKGVVRDKKYHEIAIRNVISASATCGLYPTRIMKSPITGGDGNTEFLLLSTATVNMAISDTDIREAINE